MIRGPTRLHLLAELLHGPNLDFNALVAMTSNNNHEQPQTIAARLADA
jgi:hypothetical protein